MSRGSVKLDELEDALDYVSSGDVIDCQAFLCLATGKIHCYADEFSAWEEPLPEDVDDSEKYLPIPHKKELDLGKRLVMRFVAEAIPNELDEVEAIFRRRGAYRKFKDLLERHGALERWYAFESESTKEALRAWCSENDLQCIE